MAKNVRLAVAVVAVERSECFTCDVTCQCGVVMLRLGNRMMDGCGHSNVPGHQNDLMIDDEM